MRMTGPVRMCVVCRERQPQGQLMRIGVTKNQLYRYEAKGRSLYLCSNCYETQGLCERFLKRFKIDKARLDELVKGSED